MESENKQKPLYDELLAIAANDPHFIGTLQVVEVAFTKIPSLVAVREVTNLLELTLLHTSISSLEGLQATAHSLQKLTVISGCIFDSGSQLNAIESCFLEMTNLVFLNLSENQISKLENLENCGKLEQLFLYCNSIKKIENL